MQKIDIGIIKQSAYKPLKQEKYNEKIKDFFSPNFDIMDVKKIEEFLKSLHSVDYQFLFDKKFTINYKQKSMLNIRLTKELAYFNFKRDANIADQKQKICIKSPTNFKSTLTKKTFILDNYIHESTHEKQFDKCLSNSKENEYTYLLANSFSKKTNLAYFNNLAEIDTRLEIIDTFTNLYKSNIVPLTLSTLYSQIKNLTEVFLGLDLKFKRNNKLTSFDIAFLYKENLSPYITEYGKNVNIKSFMQNFRNILDEKLLKCEENASFIVINSMQLLKQKYKYDYAYICNKILNKPDLTTEDILKNKYTIINELEEFLYKKCEYSLLPIGKAEPKLDETIFETGKETEKE